MRQCSISRDVTKATAGRPATMAATRRKARMTAYTFDKRKRVLEVELERKVNDPIDLYVNQRRVATADVGVADDRLIITILDVLKRATE